LTIVNISDTSDPALGTLQIIDTKTEHRGYDESLLPEYCANIV